MNPTEAFSYPVLLLEMLADTGKQLGKATGVLFDVDRRRYLVTNYHVVTGRDPFTGKLKNACRTARVAVHYRVPSKQAFPELARIEENLYDEHDNALWIEPENRKVEMEGHKLDLAIDLVILPVQKRTQCPGLVWQDTYPFYLHAGEHVSIIGYPFSLSDVGNFPIWLTGTVASARANTPEREFFLLDSRTRPSCSGSLVIHSTRGASASKPGGSIDNSGNVHYVMGIYSGRVNKRSDIGIVWQCQLLERLFKLATQGTK